MKKETRKDLEYRARHREIAYRILRRAIDPTGSFGNRFNLDRLKKLCFTIEGTTIDEMKERVPKDLWYSEYDRV